MDFDKMFSVTDWWNSSWPDLNDSSWFLNDNENETTGSPVVSPPPDLIFQIMEKFLEYRISQYLGIYGYAIVIAVGTIGNAVSLWVMTRASMINLSTCFYMAVLAVADTIVLYFSCLQRFINYVSKYQTSDASEAACKILISISYWSFQFSAWILVVMTIDRFLAIHFPLKAASFRILRYRKSVVAIVAVVCMLFDVQYFFIVKINNEGHCQPLEEHKHFHEDVWPWLDATIYSFLPFLVIFIFNMIIIYDNRKAQRQHQVLHAAVESGVTSMQTRQDINKKITVMLLTVSFSYLIMSAPKAILLIIRSSAFVFFEGEKVYWEVLARYRLFSVCASILMYTNHSINFFLYCISGQKFRQELRDIFQRHAFVSRWKQHSMASTCTSLSELNSRMSSGRASTSSESLSSTVCNLPDPNPI